MDTQDRKLPGVPQHEAITSTPTSVSAVPDTLAEPALDETTPQITKKRRRMPNMPEWFEVLWSNRKARVGLIMLAFFLLVAIFAGQIAPYNPNDISFGPSEQPSWQHL